MRHDCACLHDTQQVSLKSRGISVGFISSTQRSRHQVFKTSFTSTTKDYCLAEAKNLCGSCRMIGTTLLAVLVISLAAPHGNQAQTCSGVTIVSRAAWGARAPISTTYMATPVSRVFIHHTAGSSCSTSATCIQQAKNVQNYHMKSNNWYDVGYSFLVGGDGNIYEGRGWNTVGSQVYYFNSKSIGISFMGNFMTQSPTAAAINAAKNLIACGVSSGKISTAYKLYGHRQAYSTDCPGNTLYSLIQSWAGYTSGKVY